MTRKRKKVSPFTVLNYLLFIVIGIIMVYPFWYVVMYSFSDPTQSSLSSLYLPVYRFLQLRILNRCRNLCQYASYDLSGISAFQR